jgi:hypothetical protein
VKTHALAVCLLVVLTASSVDSQKSLPETPGKLEIAKHPLVLEAPIGPQEQKFDPVKVHQEAADLAQLAQTIPADVDQTSQGKLPKDLADKLRRIEKLSKRLRAELVP